MHELIQLIDIVTRQKVSQIEIITEDAKLSTKASGLLDGIRKGELRSDSEAMEILYGFQNVEAYKKVKSRLKERLYNTLFFIDIKKYRKGQGPQKRFLAYKQFSQLMLLKTEGHQQLSSKIAKKLLVKTEKYEMSDLTLLLSKQLEEYYLLWEPNSAKADFYSNKFDKIIELQRIEKELTKLWTKLGNLLLTNRSEKTKIDKNDIEIKIDYFSKLSSKYTGHLFNYRLFASKIFYYWLIKDYIKQKEICIEAILYLQSYVKSFPATYLLTTTYKAIAELNLKEYSNSEETLENLLQQFPITPGKLHWLNIYNYLFLIKMIKKDYTESAKLLSEVTSLRGFKKLDEKWRQPWLIKEAFINILFKMKKLRIEEPNNFKLRPFRINKFLNNVPIYAKDKRGANIAILIAQFIFLLADNKTDKLFDKLDGLNQYCHRYLRNDATLRSNCFIKMLMKIPTANFHPVRVQNHTKEYWKKLQDAPMAISEQSYEVEVIPYEDLWEIVLEILENHKG